MNKDKLSKHEGGYMKMGKSRLTDDYTILNYNESSQREPSALLNRQIDIDKHYSHLWFHRAGD